MVKNLPTSAGDTGDPGLIPGQEDPLLQYSCRKIPWTEKPGQLQSLRLQSWTQLSTLAEANKKQNRRIVFNICGMHRCAVECLSYSISRKEVGIVSSDIDWDRRDVM